jgi:hypothetical protein
MAATVTASASAATAAALCLAGFPAWSASLGLVGESALGIAGLVIGGMNEILAAIGTYDGLVLERH